MIVITGASNNHYLTLMNMINSFIRYNENHKLIIFNLGLDEDKWIFIKEKYKYYDFIYKIFDFSKYPEWFNINIGAGQYAWKPTIIYNISLEFPTDILVWMDSGNLILTNLTDLEKFIEKNGVYSATSSGTIKDWTHPLTIKFMDCTWTDRVNRNGACIGFNLNIKFAKNLLTDFYNYAQIKDCIYPDGSSRKNHRQDQAVFTILFYKYCINNEMYYSNDWKNHLCYSIHNDIEPHWDK
jgi:hypothetical protein